LLTDALKGSGIDALAAALDAHWSWLSAGDGGARKKRLRMQRRVVGIVESRARRWLRHSPDAAAFIEDRLNAGVTDASQVAEQLARELGRRLRDGSGL
jgi:putative protein kinase ArgK-like GTPase of G3E family